MFVIAFQDYLDDEQIRKTHREPAETGSEEERLQQLRDEWFKEYDDMLFPEGTAKGVGDAGTSLHLCSHFLYPSCDTHLAGERSSSPGQEVPDDEFH